MPRYKYTGAQAGAVSYTSGTRENGKAALTDWSKARTFGKGGDVFLCVTDRAGLKLKLPQSVIDDDANWRGGTFSLPASALEITAVADSPAGCLAALRAATKGPSNDPDVLFTDLISQSQAGKEFLTVRLADADAGADRWAAEG